MKSLHGQIEHSRRHFVVMAMAVVWSTIIVEPGKSLYAESDTLLAQVGPMRQESITHLRAPSVSEDADAAAGRSDEAKKERGEGVAQQAQSPLSLEEGGVAIGYDPAGRRDPFAPVIQDLQQARQDENLPPLQRVALTELNLIAIVWGAHGYTAMVQTPEGHGYTIKRGTRIGQNNGVVSAITERGIIVQERFTDVYGRKQEREFVKLLHPKEGSE
ncbi:MAG: pilus assembly protein PilP [Nitrospira sp.]|nr:pilus assembly protein PilP [Nitrospira sp.]